jgi:hypothetical protein
LPALALEKAGRQKKKRIAHGAVGTLAVCASPIARCAL